MQQVTSKVECTKRRASGDPGPSPGPTRRTGPGRDGLDAPRQAALVCQVRPSPVCLKMVSAVGTAGSPASAAEDSESTTAYRRGLAVACDSRLRETA